MKHDWEKCDRKLSELQCWLVIFNNSWVCMQCVYHLLIEKQLLELFKMIWLKIVYVSVYIYLQKWKRAKRSNETNTQLNNDFMNDC